ncbi:hypothetical protein CEUSTIGMA_g4935.t1 [Chlamydomonas eustigma]|uniref:Uncharacterized protein n=1 Tax=Chlamydomonas eustigma TaxID=1157962 RepID=A0A250X352_9CHLO|nr:hypothetical protein CEUSTIGMA_g4935.t1 [Chlamydomonas eustigma]|eukprot:GAX77491.1 hypothetical protein CEUSTIGMA_g4935.t1 [Chlamydomonas eustigma]
MGCCNSKQTVAVAPAPLSPAPEEIVNIEEPPVQAVQEEEFKDEGPPDPMEPIISRDDGTMVPELGYPLSFLSTLSAQADQSATPRDVLEKVIMPETHALGCRLAELRKDKVGKPTYFVRQCWTRAYRELVTVIEEHIKDMEPELPSSDVFVWLDILSTNPHSKVQQDIDLTSIQKYLTQARATLVCVESAKANPGHECIRALPAGSNSGDHVRSDLGTSIDGHQVCMIMFRANEGIHGFHHFGTVHVRYM